MPDETQASGHVVGPGGHRYSTTLRRSRKWVWGASLIILVACGGRSRNAGKNGNNEGSGGDTIGSLGGADTDGGDGASGGRRDRASGGSNEAGGSGGSPLGSGGATMHSGGDSSTGGSGADPSLLLPDDCEITNNTADDSRCGLAAKCTQWSNSSICQRLPSDNWQCSCDFINSDRVYEISGAPGANACAVAVSLCANYDLELGEEECESREGTPGENYCETSLACGRPITVDFASGIDAWLMDYTGAVCNRSGNDQDFDCECTHKNTNKRRGVIADNASDACDALATFCRDESTSNVDEPEACELNSKDSTADSCNLLQTCMTPIAEHDGITIGDLGVRGSTCTRIDATRSRCTCSGVDSTFSFEVEAQPNASSCETTSLNCGKDVELQATADASCAPSSQSSGVDFCSVDLDCRQPATADGRALIADGRLMVLCRQESAGEPWWCSCTSDQESVTFEYGPTQQTPWEICEEAPTRCQELMPVHLGIYGDVLAPPDPVPRSNDDE